MAEVVALNGEPIEPEGDYDVALVEMLEIAIKEVKRGKVHSVAIVMVHHQGDGHIQIDTTWQGKRLWLMAGATRLAYRLNVDQDESNAEQDP